MSKIPGSNTNVALRESIQHPLTLFPTALGFLGSFGTLLFGVNTIGVSVAAGGLAVGVGSFLVNYFLRGEVFVQKYLNEAHRRSIQQMESLLDKLKSRVVKKEIPSDILNHANQAIDQLALLFKKFEAFKGLLNQKLNPNELSFGRYLASADQVQLAILDNLENISVKLSSISSIDNEYIKEHIQEIKKQKNIDAVDEAELQALIARQQVRQEQIDKVNALLTYNEQALTQLAKTNSAITDMRGKDGRASTDLTSAIQELEILAKRAQNL
jgi:hypothetical protein